MIRSLRSDRAGRDLDHQEDRLNRPRIPKRAFWPLTGFVVATFLTVWFPFQHWIGDRYTAMVLHNIGKVPPPTLSWSERQIRELPGWYLWLLVAFAVYKLSQRFPLTGAHRVRHALLHLAVACGLTFLLTAALVAISPPPTPWPELSFMSLTTIIYSRFVGTFMLIYAGIVAAQHAVMYYRTAETRAIQASQLQSQLVTAQLDVLKMQIHPHFLFNALNTIASLMLSDVRAAQGMIARLSELLRLSLEGFSHHEVPLSEELRILGHYVAIQKVRFQDRLTVILDIDSRARDTLVPRLILQPLVENAVRHGIERISGEGHIIVRATLDDGRLRLQVIDDGIGLSTGPRRRPGTGVGLRNTQSRLAQLYGTDYTFDLRPNEPRGAEVIIEIPDRRKAPHTRETP